MTRGPSSLLPSLPQLVLLSIIIALALASSPSSSCSTSSSSTAGECHLLDASAFQRRVASVDTDESILPTLRGTASNLLSKEDINTLVETLPMSDFVAASGYDKDNNRDGRAYNAPNAYAGLGLKDLCKSDEVRYAKLLEIREKVRATTEESLGLRPGTLLIMNNFATSLIAQGRFVEAEQYTRRALNGTERLYGPDARETLAAANNRGILLQEQGRFPEAEALFRRVLSTRERINGAQHAETVAARANLEALQRLEAARGQPAATATGQGNQTATTAAGTAEGRTCMIVTDVAIIDGEETRVPRQLCRTPPSPRWLRV